ncbi:hypothetical protein [Rhizorhabdus wittichii]|nr:hypothetical protein [Rhizorhabdus wittichii]
MAAVRRVFIYSGSGSAGCSARENRGRKAVEVTSNMRKQIAVLLPVAVLWATAGHARSVTHHVVIDGARYRVTVKDGTAIVARKSLLVTYTLEERDRQRRAAEQVTGCRLVDEMPNQGGITMGKLDCPK